MTILLQAEDAASSSTHAVGDEYSDWFRDVHKSDQNILDPISYWYERREEYPRLSQMALDVLSVLPMSTSSNSENEFLKQQPHTARNTPARGRNGFDGSFHLPPDVLMAA
ncbi:hypothetical protein FOMG_19531 [Fusarium oxysporum f. sp. melonis 26406]|uniref:HAT C-terminal dimerisation domain-containing protein n=1 Tax=Fusarium oxysporum f. sp. melonis 26406 TaxID=1089452 RepID=W9Z613_FUSOX|nr:hypothetical protein FOMG_19531 [Fusarium oxysporum f. sp. melonis 26406]